MTRNYKAVLFDWDGTIVNTMGLIQKAHDHVRESFQLEPIDRSERVAVVFKSAREAFPDLYGDKAGEAERLFYDFYHAHHRDFLEIFEDAQSLFQMIKDNGMALGIVSNKRHETLGEEIKASGLSDYIDSYIGAGKAARDKPAADPLLMCLKDINPDLNAEDILYVGDTETDLLCAQNAGSDCVYIHHYELREDLIERYAPVLHIQSLIDIRAFLESSAQKKAC